MIYLATFDLRNIVSSSMYLGASRIAQSEVDKLKIIRKASESWSSFYDKVINCSAKCYVVLSANNFNVISGEGNKIYYNNTVMTYYFFVNRINPNRLNYTVVVNWKDGGLQRQITVEGAFVNYD